MRRVTLTVLPLTMAGILTSMIWAQGQRGSGPGGPFGQTDPYLRLFDTNNDGIDLFNNADPSDRTPDGIDDNTDLPFTGTYASPGDWRSLLFEKYSNDRNVRVVLEPELANNDSLDVNYTPFLASFIGELAPDQKDADSLPPYEVLDPLLERYIEQDQSIEQIIAAGFDAAVVKRVAGLVEQNEYKRRQGPPGIKITPRAFGRDRRVPITNRYKVG